MSITRIDSGPDNLCGIDFGKVALTDAELHWMKQACPYFTSEYLDYVASYRFKPEQVRMEFRPVTDDGKMGNINLEAIGPWAETILWEVPLMACLSELYFKFVDKDWDYDGQESR